VSLYSPYVYKTREMEPVIKERKSVLSNYILCRILIQIVQKLSRDTLPDVLGIKLEDMVFGQFNNTDMYVSGVWIFYLY
jgi:uncharacterized membrane protein